MMKQNRMLPMKNFICDEDVQRIAGVENEIHLKTSSNGGGVWLDQFQDMDWIRFQYIYADVYHESHDVLVILFTFKDRSGRTVTVHYGVLPGVKTTICLPLQALSGNRLFLTRFPGVLQSVLRGDPFVERDSLVSFGLATIASTEQRNFTVSGLQLSMEPPKFQYEPVSYIDALGQWDGKSWSGKTSSEEEMRERLARELKANRTNGVRSPEQWSKYGGWTELRFEATGYFRTEHDGERWWFVDPDGCAMFSTGIDGIRPYDPMYLAGMEHLLPELPEEHDREFQDARGDSTFSFIVANLIRAFGADDWKSCWYELTEHRLKQWGINTIGNWSDPSFILSSSLPYVYPMEQFPTTNQWVYRDFPDVFDPEYERNAERFAAQLIELRGDRRLVGYFMRNEPHWAFAEGLNLTERLLQHPEPLASKQKFLKWTQEKYGDIIRLNEAWQTRFTSFDDLLHCPSIDVAATAAVKEDFQAFHRILIRRYVEIPSIYCKKAAPYHLNLGMRYAWISSEDLFEGCEMFDVFSINCYQMKPDADLIEQISKRLNRPVMIGEYHFGAADVGLPAYGIRAVATQEERGQAYRYFLEQAAAIPDLIGVHYFQWNDQPVLGRFDGENYQIGVVDVCQRPYETFITAMKEANSRMYRVRTGEWEPFTDCPQEIPKTGF